MEWLKEAFEKEILCDAKVHCSDGTLSIHLSWLRIRWPELAANLSLLMETPMDIVRPLLYAVYTDSLSPPSSAPLETVDKWCKVGNLVAKCKLSRPGLLARMALDLGQQIAKVLQDSTVIQAYKAAFANGLLGAPIRRACLGFMRTPITKGTTATAALKPQMFDFGSTLKDSPDILFDLFQLTNNHPVAVDALSQTCTQLESEARSFDTLAQDLQTLYSATLITAPPEARSFDTLAQDLQTLYSATLITTPPEARSTTPPPLVGIATKDVAIAAAKESKLDELVSPQMSKRKVDAKEEKEEQDATERRKKPRYELEKSEEPKRLILRVLEEGGGNNNTAPVSTDFSVDRWLMAARSDYFAAMLEKSNFEESTTNVVVVQKLTWANRAAMTALLQYFYTGILAADFNEYIQLMQADQFYMIRGGNLRQTLVKAIMPYIDEKNVLIILKMACEHRFTALIDSIMASFSYSRTVIATEESSSSSSSSVSSTKKLKLGLILQKPFVPNMLKDAPQEMMYQLLMALIKHHQSCQGEIELKVGTIVDAFDSRFWMHASIVTIKDEKQQIKVKIHYTEWGPEWDEWMSYPNTRIAPAGTHVLHHKVNGNLADLADFVPAETKTS